jgi:hypothetical protein
MEFVEGTQLSALLKQENCGQLILKPDIDGDLLDKIYLQIADYMLQLSRLEFRCIGAIARDEPSGVWDVKSRPLTYNHNEILTTTGYATSQLPQSTFDTTSGYLKSIAGEHLSHAFAQRNLAFEPEIAEARFVARKQFEKLIPKYCIRDDGPFLPYCDDFRPSNMIVNPETLEITAVLDVEFTNAMPAQYTYDPPWWLLLENPEHWIELDKMEEFHELYVPRMQQFLRAMERREEVAKEKGEDTKQNSALPGPKLSTLMREAWDSGRFWFNIAARKTMDVDVIYWGLLHEQNYGKDATVEDLNQSESSERESFVRFKMEQVGVYTDECRVKFPNTEED